MKRIFAIGFLAVSLLSCSHKREAELDAKEAQLEKQERVQDSIRIVEDTKDQMAANQAAASAHHAVTHSAASQPSSSSSSTSSSSSSTQTAEEKQGLNNKAKGAIIGAGVGALTGAVIDKDHRGRGAIIGGIVGAGTGLGAGAIIDKKKEQQQSGGN